MLTKLKKKKTFFDILKNSLLVLFEKKFTYIAPPGDLISTRVGPEGKIFPKK